MRLLSPFLFPALISFLAGIGFASYFFSSFSFALLFLCIAVALFCYRLLGRESAYIPLAVVIAFGVACGIFRYETWASAPLDPLLTQAVGETVLLRGTLSDEADVRESRTHLRVALEAKEESGVWQEVSGSALVLVSHYPEYNYGDVVEFKGKLELPKKFASDEGRTFDYPAYLKTKGVTFQSFSPNVRLLSRDGGNPLMRYLFSLKHAFLENISRVVPEPNSALAGGILFGGKQSLGEEWMERFRVVGLVHIVVLSGYNMTIIAEYVGKFFQLLKFGFYGSIGFSALAIIFFAFMAGLGATVVRAAIMALLVLLARLTGRTYVMGRALLVACVLMVIHNPGILAHDPSFQLSFLASLGLIYVAPLIESRLWRSKRFPVLREVVVATLSTQLFVLPLLLYQTGMLSLISVVANVLVLPVVPFAMLFAFLTGLSGFAGDLISYLPGFPAVGLLSWMLLTTKVGVMIPFAAVTVPPIPGVLVFGLYALLTAGIWQLRSFRSR